jgi:uncharacterized protein DUF2474
MPIGNTHRNPEPPLLRRLGWFVLLWLGGIASVAAVSLVLRYWLHP